MNNLEREDGFCFELYKIQKTESGIGTIKTHIKLDQTSAQKIKDHITGFFDSKNSYYKHLELPSLPNGWLKAFSDPIAAVFSPVKKSNEINFEYLIDCFIKQGLSPQSHNMAKRDKYLLIIYKEGIFFILAHLTVKKGITLEGENLEISNLLFSSDTLLRYLHITMTENNQYDMVVWEQTLTQTFVKFLDIGEDFFNKDSYGDLSIYGKNGGSSITIQYPPADFFEQYIAKNINLINQNGKLKFVHQNGLNIIVDKITVGKTTIDINKAFEISFFEKLAINTSIQNSLQQVNQLHLFSDSVLIKEGINYIQVGSTPIQKIFGNSDECIYFSFPLGSDTSNIQYDLEQPFLDFIYNALFFQEDKKIIVFSLYEKKVDEYLDSSFQDIFNNSIIFFSNLGLEINEKINQEVQLIREKIKNCDTEIIKSIYKIYLLISFCYHLQGYNHLFAYFNLLLEKYIHSFSETKSLIFTESENDILEYKNGNALSFQSDWKESVYNRIKSDIQTKIKKINLGCILYGFDEKERKITGILQKDFRKFNDDVITEFEEKIKKDCSLKHIHIYKIPGNLNILLIYMYKE